MNEVNNAPLIGALPMQTVNEGDLLHFAISASDPDTPANTWTYSLGANTPAGMQIDPQNGELTWVPDETQGPATYDVIVFATDDGTPPAIGTRTIQIQVNEVNRPPVLAASSISRCFKGTSSQCKRLRTILMSR